MGKPDTDQPICTWSERRVESDVCGLPATAKAVRGHGTFFYCRKHERLAREAGTPDITSLSRESDAIDELQKILDVRWRVGQEILDCIEKARAAYARDKTGVNLPRCSREHLDYIAKDLTQYVEDTRRVRNQLPRLLSNEEESLD